MGIEAWGKHFHLNFGVEDGPLWIRLSGQGEDFPADAWRDDSRVKTDVDGFGPAGRRSARYTMDP